MSVGATAPITFKSSKWIGGGGGRLRRQTHSWGEAEISCKTDRHENYRYWRRRCWVWEWSDIDLPLLRIT
jgi:hypothetical protein